MTARLRTAQLWLALLNLGSFRSPFVPDAYALMGTTWLLTLVAAESMGEGAVGKDGRGMAWRALGFVTAAVMFGLVFDGIWTSNPPRWVVVLTLANQLLALGLNSWVIARAIRVRARLVASARPVPARP